MESNALNTSERTSSHGEGSKRRRWGNWVLLTIHAATAVYFLYLAHATVALIKPVPASDFAYYWALAGDYALYHKGGIIGILYMPLKAAGISPHWAAFAVNSCFFVVMALATWVLPMGPSSYGEVMEEKGGAQVRSRYDVRSILPYALQIFASGGLAMYGLWNAGYAGMVNADFPNVALLIVAVRFLFAYAETGQSRLCVLGGLALYLTVALRVKTGLALGIIVVLTVLIHFKRIKRSTVIKGILLTVCIAVVCAAGTELALRRQSQRQTDVARQGRLQLYTGLLFTDIGPLCGRWTRAAYDKTLEELEMPLSQVISKHLGVKSKRYILDIIRCKLTAVLGYGDFSYRELFAFGIPPGTHTPEQIGFISEMERIEKDAAATFKLWVYAVMALATVWGLRTGTGLWSLPLIIFFAFLCLHAVFEIQARYMMEPLLWSYFVGIISLRRAV